MVEQVEDKWDGIDMTWKGAEKNFWLRAKNKLRLLDLLEGDKKEN